MASLVDCDWRQLRGPNGRNDFELWLAALQAATDGMGVALGHTPLVEKDLAAGRLVAPLDCELPNEFA